MRIKRIWQKNCLNKRQGLLNGKEITVDAIVDTYKVAKKVASKGVEAAKGIVKNAKKSVANWWKNTKSSLSFAF